MIRKFSFIVLSVCVLLLASVQNNSISADYAATSEADTSEEVSLTQHGYQNIGGGLWLNTFTGDMLMSESGTLSAAGIVAVVLVFVIVAGLNYLIGEFTGGVLLYASGRSASEWGIYVASAVADLGKGLWKGAAKLFVDGTTKKPIRASNSAGCFSYEAKATHYICPMRLGIA